MNEATQDHDLRAWLELQAVMVTKSDDIRSRYASGELLEVELTHAARGELFKGFERFERWGARNGRRDMLAEVRETHDPDCSRKEIDSEFTHDNTDPVAEVPLHRLALIRDLARSKDVHPWMLRQAASSTVTAHAVRYTCAGCGVSSVRYVARVLFPWAGRTLTREFLL